MKVIALLLAGCLGLGSSLFAANNPYVDYQNYNQGYCSTCNCYPCMCAPQQPCVPQGAPCAAPPCGPCGAPACGPCDAGAPVCGAECGISICAIGVAVAAVAAAAAIIIASGNGHSAH